MILAYRIFTTLIYPLLLIFVYLRKLLKKEDDKRYKEKILISHFKIDKKFKSKLIWFHAASIGEFRSILPIIDLINNEKEKFNFLITTTTISSGKLAEVELRRFNNVVHRYFPLDVPFLIDKFLLLWKPKKIFLVDSEIWPNLIFKSKKYNIPIALINARLTSRSYKKWIMFPKEAKKIFSLLDLCLCSNKETEIYLDKLGSKNIYFKGNIKLIDQIDEKNIENINKDFLLQKRFWFAASIHKEEDAFCLKTHLKLKEKFKDIITIIAPRHIEMIEKIKILSEKLKLKPQVLSKNESILEDKEIIIINQFGVLKNYFKYAKSVFIGKSMVKSLQNEGGQNPIEAAKLKCKIYHGPYVYNFQDIYEMLDKNIISNKIENFEELGNKLIKDLIDPIKHSNHEFYDPLKKLEKDISIETMKLINNFLK